MASQAAKPSAEEGLPGCCSDDAQVSSVSTPSGSWSSGATADRMGVQLVPAPVPAPPQPYRAQPLPLVPRKFTVLRQVVLPSPPRRAARTVGAAGRADALRASGRYEDVAPMTDRLSQRPVPPFDPPERFAGGDVVAAVRCPVDVSTLASRDHPARRQRLASRPANAAGRQHAHVLVTMPCCSSKPRVSWCGDMRMSPLSWAATGST